MFWKTRNKNIIQNAKQDTPSLHHILKVASEFINIRNIHKLAPPTTITHYIKWYPPIAPYIKLYIDGAFTSANNHGGAGGVFRNTEGKWILGFSVDSTAHQAIKLNFKH